MSSLKHLLLESINNLREDDLNILNKEIHNFINILNTYYKQTYINKIENISDSQVNVKFFQTEDQVLPYQIIDDKPKLENYISSLKLQEVNELRKMAKNFYILYNEISKELIIDCLAQSLKNMKIKALRRISDKLILVHITFYKQYKLHKNHSRLIVDNKLPVKLYTKAKHFIHNKENNKHDNYNQSNNIFNICKELNKDDKDNYHWMRDKPVPFLKGSSTDENHMIDKDVLQDFHQYIYKLFNHQKYKVNCDNLCRSFLDEIDTLNLGLYNEYICNYIFMNSIIQVNNTMRNKLDILSVDYRYRENILNELLYFRPDIVLQNGDTLIVIEFKYRLDRKNQKLDAINCIHYKMYGPRLLNYLKENDYETFKEIECVMYIGFSYSYLNDTSCGIIYEVYNKSVVMTDSYKTDSFIRAMKKCKKRFKKL